MSAEPTAEQREAAEVLFDQLLTMHGGTDQTYAIARALAAAVTAEREKVLAIHYPVSQNQYAAYPVKDPHDVCAHCNTHTWPCRTAYALGIREVSS